jgi:hypothetical protein
MEEFHKVRRLAALRLRTGQPAEGVGAGGGATSSISGWAIRTFRHPRASSTSCVEAVQDPRTHRYSTSRGIPGLRRAQAATITQRRFGVKLNPDTPGGRYARLQGRLRQHGAGDHRSGRRDPVPEPDLSDPRLRLHHVGRRDPFARCGAGRQFLCSAGTRGEAFDPQAAGADPELPVEPDQRMWPRSISTRT